MERYTDSLNALNQAMNMTIEEGNTLLIAAIAYPLHLVETEILQKRIDIMAQKSKLTT